MKRKKKEKKILKFQWLKKIHISWLSSQHQLRYWGEMNFQMWHKFEGKVVTYPILWVLKNRHNSPVADRRTNQIGWKARNIYVASNLEDGGNHIRKNTEMGPQSSRHREPDSYCNLCEFAPGFLWRVWEWTLDWFLDFSLFIFGAQNPTTP